MIKYFYTHLMDISSLLVELNELDLTEAEKLHLATLIDSTLHHHILEAILSELSEEDKQLFWEHLSQNDHKKTWDFVNQRVDKLEEKIKKTAEEVKKQLHKDIAESKQLHEK